MTALLLILVFLLFQTFVLLCCVAAGNDAASQEISERFAAALDYKTPIQYRTELGVLML